MSRTTRKTSANSRKPAKPATPRPRKTSAKAAPKAGAARQMQAEPAAAKTKETKSHKALALLRRANGATLAELMQATGWQAHSVRGFLSGTVRKRLDLALESSGRAEERRYWIVGDGR